MAAQVAAPKPAAGRLGYYGQNTGGRTSRPPAAYPAATVAPAGGGGVVAAQPRYRSLELEQATAQRKAQLTPSSKRKGR